MFKKALLIGGLLFVLWKLSLQGVLLPVTHSLVDLSLRVTLNDMYQSIEQGESGDALTVHTRLFNASKPYSHNTYAPNLSVNGVTSVGIHNFSAYTLGLPLLWCLLILLSKRKLITLLLGTGLMLFFIVLAINIKVWFELTRDASSLTNLRYIVGGYIKTPSLLPAWTATYIKPLLDIISACLTYVFPLIIAYALCKKEITHLIQKDTQLTPEPEQNTKVEETK